MVFAIGHQTDYMTLAITHLPDARVIALLISLLSEGKVGMNPSRITMRAPDLIEFVLDNWKLNSNMRVNEREHLSGCEGVQMQRPLQIGRCERESA